MFELRLPWWEIPARATLIYLVLLLMVRISGKRTVGQFTPFDLLVVMLLSEAVSNALSGGDESLSGGLLAAASLIFLNLLAGWASSRSKRIERLLEGTPILIGRDGRWFDDVIRKQRLGRCDIEKSLREADCTLKEMQMAILEADGQISVLKKRT